MSKVSNQNLDNNKIKALIKNYNQYYTSTIEVLNISERIVDSLNDEEELIVFI